MPKLTAAQRRSLRQQVKSANEEEPGVARTTRSIILAEGAVLPENRRSLKRSARRQARTDGTYSRATRLTTFAFKEGDLTEVHSVPYNAPSNIIKGSYGMIVSTAGAGSHFYVQVGSSYCWFQGSQLRPAPEYYDEEEE
jgi:hypothetical protein